MQPSVFVRMRDESVNCDDKWASTNLSQYFFITYEESGQRVNKSRLLSFTELD